MSGNPSHTARPAGRLVEAQANDLASSSDGHASANDCLRSGVSPRTPRRAAPQARASSLSRVAEQLSARDRAVLSSLKQLRLLTAPQVERLHFQEGSVLTQSRRCRRTLNRLYHLNLLHRLERRIGGMHAGSSGFIYGLSGWGQRLLDAPGPAGGARRRRPWEPSAAFQDHVLAVSELCVRLHEAARSNQLELLEFLAEPACWRTFNGLAGEQLVLKPDAFVHLAQDNLEVLSFVEVDRSTEGLAVIRRKGMTYRDYWQRGGEQQRHGVFPMVVFLTLDQRRAKAIETELRRIEATAGFFVVAKFESALPVLVGGGP